MISALSHCEVVGNDYADKVARTESKEDQSGKGGCSWWQRSDLRAPATMYERDERMKE